MIWVVFVCLICTANAVVYPVFYNAPSNLTRTARRQNVRRRRLEAGETALHGDRFGYWTYVYLGTTHQKFSVIIDTGSMDLAVPCSSCTDCGNEHNRYSSLVSNADTEIMCNSQQCGALGNPNRPCRQDGRCEFKISFVEQSQLSGYWIKDKFWFGGDSWGSQGHVGGGIQPFGCIEQESSSSDEESLFVSQGPDGVLGLSGVRHNVVKTMKAQNMITQTLFSLCFTAEEGGRLSIGEVTTDTHLGEQVHTPLSISSTSANFYEVMTTDVSFVALEDGKENHVATTKTFRPSVKTILDSGSTYTYLTGNLFTQFENAFRSQCEKMKCPKMAPANEFTDYDGTFCWRLSDTHSRSEEAINKMFPVLRWTLQNGAIFHVEPSAYISSEGHNLYCVRVYESSGGDNLIGANFFVNHDVTFNLDRKSVSIARAVCGKPIVQLHTHSPTPHPSRSPPPSMPPWNPDEHEKPTAPTPRPTVIGAPTEERAYVWINPTPGATPTNSPTVDPARKKPTMAPTINREDRNRSSSPTLHRADRYVPGSLVNPDGSPYSGPGGHRASVAPTSSHSHSTSSSVRPSPALPTVEDEHINEQDDSKNDDSKKEDSESESVFTTKRTSTVNADSRDNSVSTSSSNNEEGTTTQDIANIIGAVSLVLVILMVFIAVLGGILSRLCGYKAKISFHRIQDDMEPDFPSGVGTVGTDDIELNVRGGGQNLDADDTADDDDEEEAEDVLLANERIEVYYDSLITPS